MPRFLKRQANMHELRDHSKGKLHGHISENAGTQVHILASLAAFTLVSHGTLSCNQSRKDIWDLNQVKCLDP